MIPHFFLFKNLNSCLFKKPVLFQDMFPAAFIWKQFAKLLRIVFQKFLFMKPLFFTVQILITLQKAIVKPKPLFRQESL